MQKVLCFGTSFYVALLFLISRNDPSNLLLWFSNINSATLFAYLYAVAILVFLGIKSEIQHTGVRRATAFLGMSVILLSSLGAFTKFIVLPLRPLDYMLAFAVGIALTVKGLTLPLITPDGEPASAPGKISLTYPLHVLRYGALAIKNASSTRPNPVVQKTHTA